MTTTKYRTSDGVADYAFEFLQADGRWQANIARQPSYGARSAELASTGRSLDSRGRHLVRASADAGTREAALAAARDWAEANQHYLRTGRWDTARTSRPACPPRGPQDVQYHASDGVGVYVFRFDRHGSIWRAVIVRQPPYAGRAEGAHSSHRLGLGTGSLYVCWTPEPRTHSALQEVARLWAEGTQFYIAHGRFPGPSEIPAAPSPLRQHRTGNVGPPLRRTRLQRLRDRLG